MKLKIDPTNTQAIEAALAKINGTALQHTFNRYAEVAAVADQAEAMLDGLSLKKSSRRGAAIKAVSGASVPLSYSWARQGTRIVLERRATAWYLIDLAPAKLYQRGGRQELRLTLDQDAEAVTKLRSTYTVAGAKTDAKHASQE